MIRCDKLVALLSLCALLAAGLAQGGTRRLALELAREGDHLPAALEFRRLALGDAEEEERAGYYWLAGHQYGLAGDYERSEDMLDRAEDLDWDILDSATLLRAENAVGRRRPNEAEFYFESLLPREDEATRYAALRLASLRLRQGKFGSARQLLSEHAPDDNVALESLRRYRAGSDKSPVVGGMLGMIPGFGHFYSGEYANGLRAMILNAIFIYGMVETASDDHWGAFTVITFFELTWYSGSIYGGIDAAHRHNRDRLERAVDGIEGNSNFEPQWQAAPTIAIEFTF